MNLRNIIPKTYNKFGFAKIRFFFEQTKFSRGKKWKNKKDSRCEVSQRLPFCYKRVLLVVIYVAIYGVFHEAGDGHWTDTTGNWGDEGGLRCDIVEVDVTTDFAGLRVEGSADIDDGCASLDHILLDELRTTDGRDEDVSLRCD